MTRIFLVDDHPVLRKILRLLPGSHPGLQVVGAAGSGTDPLAHLAQVPADVVLLDLCLYFCY